MSALDDLEQLARRRGWRLRWRAAAAPGAPGLTLTEVDIFAGKRLLNAASVWMIHSEAIDARTTIARQILEGLARSSPPTVAA